jgi:hypothetical protein
MSPDKHEDYQEDATDDKMVVPEESVDETQVEDKPTDEQTQTVKTSGEEPVTWQASEYIHLEKNGLWYVLLILASLGLIALAIFVINSYTFAVLIVVMAIFLVIYSRVAPKVVQYTLSGDQGLYVDEKLYHFTDFKSFGLIKDGEHHSIMLTPVKRFSPGVSVYFPEEVGERIVDILGARLPMKAIQLDLMDHLIRRLRL